MKIRNIWLAFLDQGPPRRFIRNLIKTRFAGLFHINSHISQASGLPKVMYNTKKTALGAAQTMMKKRQGFYFSAYKCLYCDGFHIGKNSKVKKEDYDENLFS